MREWLPLSLALLLGCRRTPTEDVARADPAPSTAKPSPCGDTSANPKHCGACGHDCLGSECREGHCLPTTLATLKGPIEFAAASAEWVYFIDAEGFVSRIPAAGGAATRLPKIARARGVWVFGADVYVTTEKDILRALGGGDFQTIAKGEVRPRVLGIAGDHLAFVENEDAYGGYRPNSLRVVPLTSGPARVLYAGFPMATAFLAEGDNIFFDDSGRLVSMPLAGGPSTLIGDGLKENPKLRAVRRTTKGLYVVAQNGGGTFLAKLTGDRKFAYGAHLGPPGTPLVVSRDATVWWVDDGRDLRRAPIDADAPKPSAKPGRRFGELVLDVERGNPTAIALDTDASPKVPAVYAFVEEQEKTTVLKVVP